MHKNNNEFYGNVPVEHYLIEAEDGINLSVTHICGCEGNQPVVLLHGTYTNRHFWISPKGKGFAPYLSDQGYDVWIPEFRGHGKSPKTSKFKQFSAEEQIRCDISAFGKFVLEKSGRVPAWIGHSYGGLYLYGALSQGWLPPADVNCIVTFGSQISKGDRYLKIPFVPFLINAITQLLGKFPAKSLGLGPEIESPKTIREILEWKKLGGRWKSQNGTSYWKGFSHIKIPCLIIASRGDKNDPAEGCEYLFRQLPTEDNQFILLGEEEGFAKDYDHVGMVIDKMAQKEVWPLILEWLNKKAATTKSNCSS
ncbi:alpha/beta fold hydrolase [Desulfatiferula olefinivorans]